jgi:hypothetical protein
MKPKESGNKIGNKNGIVSRETRSVYDVKETREVNIMMLSKIRKQQNENKLYRRLERINIV